MEADWHCCRGGAVGWCHSMADHKGKATMRLVLGSRKPMSNKQPGVDAGWPLVFDRSPGTRRA